MGKAKLQPLKGFRDFLPPVTAVRRKAVDRLRSVFEKYGFSEVLTPALEYREVLIGKYGDEAEKLIYLFKDKGGRAVGLRYDLTVPLARVMATHRDLPIPFKRYQIQPVWRADKPQKGRYREIYQCDFDIVGSSSAISDAEIIAILNDALTALGLLAFKIRVNSREVLSSCLKLAKISKELESAVITSIDKLDKKPQSDVEKELASKGLSSTQIKSLFKAISASVPDKYLDEVMGIAAKLGITRKLEFDAKLARGLDYYTGPIFEVSLDEPKIGSVAGGGRYDHLLSDLGGPNLPATGASIGLDRVIDVISEVNLWEGKPRSSAKVLVTIFSQKLIDSSLSAANLLRRSGIDTELYPDSETKLEKQLKYADKKGIPWAVIIGPKEVLNGEAVLKNLEKKKQETIPVSALVTRIK
ncbi:histidine--tRNA ligase [Patescibacteria group bacterium]|nr:histidine--tRNA ligase [Patescibacteria group bacterium]